MTTVQDIPINILLQIFDYIDEFKNLTEVCHEWKNYIEDYHTFSEIKIGRFLEADTIEKIFASKRQYRSIYLDINSRNYSALIKKFEEFTQNQKTLKSATIDLKEDQTILDDFIIISMDHLHGILEILSFVEELTINVRWTLLKFRLHNPKIIKFGQLKSLRIVDKCFSFWPDFESILKYIEAPCLKELLVNFAGRCNLPKCPLLFDLLVKQKDTLETVSIDAGLTASLFNLTDKTLVLHNLSDYRVKVSNFFKNSKILLELEDITLLQETAPRASDVLAGLSILNITENSSFPNVKYYTTCYFIPNEANIIALSKIFPNLEAFTFLVSRFVSEVACLLMKDKFRHLKRVNNQEIEEL